MESYQDIILGQFPGRITLSCKEVALLIYGQDSRAACNGVRDRLMAGTLIPGLRKNGRRWVIPILALARAMEALVEVPRREPPNYRSSSTDLMPTRKGRRRSPIGPTLGDY